MSRELRDLLSGIVEKEDLIRAWAVEVGPGGSSLRAQTRRSFERREDALRAAHLLLEELVASSHREVRAAVPGATAQETAPDHEEWRGFVDVELAPM
jgi:hypothetical protein